MPTDHRQIAEAPGAVDPEPPGSPGPTGRWARHLGPLTGLRVVALVVAVAFLAGAVGWAIGQRDDDPLSDVDVGFLRDMGFHHEQAVELSLILLYKDDIDREARAYAQEIIVGQRFEQGLFNAILARFGHDPLVDLDGEVMGWMGRPVPVDDMAGLATEEQVDALAEAEGVEATALWIALMAEHHLGGLHMADWAARHGRDTATTELARELVSKQRSEVIDIDRYRRSHDIPIPDGFGDPLEDQRLDPLSFGEP